MRLVDGKAEDVLHGCRFFDPPLYGIEDGLCENNEAPVNLAILSSRTSTAMAPLETVDDLIGPPPRAPAEPFRDPGRSCSSTCASRRRSRRRFGSSTRSPICRRRWLHIVQPLRGRGGGAVNLEYQADRLSLSGAVVSCWVAWSDPPSCGGEAKEEPDMRLDDRSMWIPNLAMMLLLGAGISGCGADEGAFSGREDIGTPQPDVEIALSTVGISPGECPEGTVEQTSCGYEYAPAGGTSLVAPPTRPAGPIACPSRSPVIPARRAPRSTV
jgi:hypothetical protein